MADLHTDQFGILQMSNDELLAHVKLTRVRRRKLPDKVRKAGEKKAKKAIEKTEKIISKLTPEQMKELIILMEEREGGILK